MPSDSFTPFILESSWHEVLKEELNQPYIKQLAAFVESEYATSPLPIYPPKDLIFNAFNHTPYKSVQVLLIGQDPYHGAGQAHGLSFSVPKGVRLPPSLQNIFKELKQDVNMPIPKHGCLISWAEQGVMLLNATLTVKEGQPMSHHKKGWEEFTDAVVKSLIERKDPVIFVLWGKSAQDKCRFLENQLQHSPHFVLKAAHPSPFSADRGFFGCHHFSKINELLVQQGKKPINWELN